MKNIGSGGYMGHKKIAKTARPKKTKVVRTPKVKQPKAKPKTNYKSKSY